MNPFAKLFYRTLPPPVDKLTASLRPDPASRAKRFSQWSRERRQKYWDACYGTPQSLLRRRANALPPASSLEGHCPGSVLPGFE